MIPKEIFFTKGVGTHKERLASFELALRDADLEKYNLVTVSSIVPPTCKLVSRQKGLQRLQPGQIIHCVLSKTDTNESNRLISAAVGMALPTDRSHYGYLAEHKAFGQTEKASGDYAEDLAATMLATTLGLEFDPDEAWDSRKKVYQSSGHIFKTRNICQSAEGKKTGDLWTTVVAAAILIVNI